MFLRYSVEDLLKLRASPLVCRPSGLPPEEQWMGSQEQANKRPTTRGRQEEGTATSEGIQKRANLDPSQRKLGADPERIVLGPPRRSFASSNGKPFGKYGGQDSEDGTRDKQYERPRDDTEYKFGDRKGFGGQNGRHGSRYDHDGIGSDRPRRRHEDEEPDARSHRDIERPKWGTKENRDDAAFDDDTLEGSSLKTGFKRDQGRSRFDQPWFRSEKGGEDGRRDRDRGSGWRNNKSKDGDSDLPSKTEVDPEWMDSADTADTFQAHTQEDFQKWKERMKAGGQKSDQTGPTSTSTLTTSAETQAAFAGPSPSVISPDPSGNSMDKFFARFNEKKTVTDEQSAAKAATKTRFASLFSPTQDAKTETVPTPQPPPPPPPSAQPPTSLADFFAATSPLPAPLQPGMNADADQAGFQRILQMLGKKESSSPAPTLDSQKAKPPGLSGVQTHQRHASPDLVALFKQDQPNRSTPMSNAPPAPPGFERLLDSRSPIEIQPRQTNTPNKDELLLNLLRQAEISTKPKPQQPYMDNRGPVNRFGGPEQHRSEQERPQMQERGGGRSLFDDPAISSMSYGGDMRPREGFQRGPNNGAPPGFEETFIEQQRSNGPQPKPVHSLPPGLQRPPGLDQMARMPPGWNQQQGPPGPAPSQNRPGMPPGLGSRGMQPFGNQQPPPPPPPPGPGPQQISGQGPARPTQQRKYTGEGDMMNFHPGMGPPPGFLGLGPPPGFQHANAAQAAQSYGRYGMGGNDRSQQPGPPPPPMDRAYMEMYGERGVPMPPGFQ